MAKTLEILCEEYNDRAPAPISTPKIGQLLGTVVWPPCVGDTVTTRAVGLGLLFLYVSGARGYVWAERDLMRVFCGCRLSTIRHFLLFHFQCVSGKSDHQVCPQETASLWPRPVFIHSR